MDTSSAGARRQQSDKRTRWSKAWLLIGFGTWAASLAFDWPVNLILTVAGAAVLRLSLAPGSRGPSWSRWEIMLLVISVGLVAGIAWSGEATSRAFGWALVVVMLAIVLPPAWQLARATFAGYTEARRIHREIREIDPSRR